MQVSCCYWKIDQEKGSWPKSEAKQNAQPLSVMMRRRLTPLGQNAVEMLYKSKSIANSEQIPWVVSCRHGDMSRMVNLLSSLSRKELLSPTDFSMSVHNAIVGIFSIATENRKSHTALSGAELSFETGLLEAFALQREKKGPVGYIYYDTLLPVGYEGKIENDSPEICLMLMLSERGYKKSETELSSETLYLSYVQNEEDIVNKNAFNFFILVRFLKSDAKKYTISVPGGYLHLERGC